MFDNNSARAHIQGVSTALAGRHGDMTTTYSIEGPDGVFSGTGIQDLRAAALQAQHLANTTGKTWYVVPSDDSEETLEYAPEPSVFEIAASQGLRVWRFTAADGRVLSDEHLIPSEKSADSIARILADREQVSVSYCELFADGSAGAVTTINPEVVQP